MSEFGRWKSQVVAFHNTSYSVIKSDCQLKISFDEAKTDLEERVKPVVTRIELRDHCLSLQ